MRKHNYISRDKYLILLKILFYFYKSDMFDFLWLKTSKETMSVYISGFG